MQARRILAAFELQGVQYVLVGSMAMAAQGLIRATRDLDAADRFSMLIAGTEDMLPTLQHHHLEPPRGRIGYAQPLRPFSLEDSRNQIRFHLQRVDADLGLFSDPAVRRIFQATSQTSYSYDKDRQLTQVTRPDGKVLAFGYDSAGRSSTLTLPRGTVSYIYDPTSGLVNGTSSPAGIGLSMSYDGSLMTGQSWTGTVQGSVSSRYNNDLRVDSCSVNSN